MNYAVIDLGFGDSGKGLVTRALSQQVKEPVVVRFSGGHQVGHTVWIGDQKHTFSNFGSGTLNSTSSIPTYWSQYATFNPTSFLNEWTMLTKKYGISPQFTIHEDAPITTPYDIAYNQLTNIHGSVGVGVGATFEREENHYHLRVRDIWYHDVFMIKLRMIRDYYMSKLPIPEKHLYIHGLDWSDFAKDVAEVKMLIGTSDEIPEHKNLIFEGSQGLMLDPNIGFFPHVTRSSLGTKNIIEIMNQNRISPDNLSIMVVTRAYQTRHGDGPMTTEGLDFKVTNDLETNRTNEHQGKFRTAMLDVDLLAYALNSDPFMKNNKHKLVLVVTCVDHLKEYKFKAFNAVQSFPDKDSFVREIAHILSIEDFVYSESRFSEELIF